MKRLMIMAVVLLSAISSCSTTEHSGALKMEPDYTNIAIPCNIAPLNFKIGGAGKIAVTIEGTSTYTFKGHNGQLRFPLKEWKKMLEAEKGRKVSISVKSSSGVIGPFFWDIRPETIDRYMSYRLIEPAYEVWNKLTIVERDITCFEERLMGDNNITENACMNCHVSNRAETPANFMHVRGKGGGTIYTHGDKLLKINTSTDSTSVAVYGEIDSRGRYGVFTTANIVPILHSAPNGRMEVYDKESDLIIIDFENLTVTSSPLVRGEATQETFPCFSADGKTIYFARAEHLEQPRETMQMHYNLYAIDFDHESGTFGNNLRLVWDAASQGLSVSFPRCSPDGKYLVMSVSNYGTFPIWHRETDLALLNIESGEVSLMEETNAPGSDTYHCWSGNSAWLCFASKRDDGMFGRPYISFMGENGGTKPFVLPQKDPDHYEMMTKSFNIPELYDRSEKYNSKDIAKIYKNINTIKLTYKK
ncbi:MAG: PD40 domain-containing protein [Bacteroidales bacterium]|nr:PD40 domain-containing protein [Bacteroidales bacterium]